MLPYRRWVVFAAPAGCLVMGLASLRLRADIRWTETIPDTSSTAIATSHCDTSFGGALMAYAVVEWPEGLELTSPELAQVTLDVHRLVEQQRLVRSPLSIYSVLQSLPGETLREQARNLRRVPNEVLSRMVNRGQRRLAVSMHVPDVGAAALAPVMETIESGLAKLEAEHPGFKLHLTGTVVVAARNVRDIVNDLAVSLGFDAAVVFLVITLGLRSLPFGLVSVIPNALPLFLVANVLLWSGQPLQVVSVLTFCLCLGIAVDDTIHFLMAFRRERSRGRDPWSAVRHTVHHCGTAVLMTSIILAGGFSVMMASVMPALRLFGLLTTLTFLVAMVSEILVLPALLTCFSPIRKAAPSSALANVSVAIETGTKLP